VPLTIFSSLTLHVTLSVVHPEGWGGHRSAALLGDGRGAACCAPACRGVSIATRRRGGSRTARCSHSVTRGCAPRKPRLPIVSEYFWNGLYWNL